MSDLSIVPFVECINRASSMTREFPHAEVIGKFPNIDCGLVF